MTDVFARVQIAAHRIAHPSAVTSKAANGGHPKGSSALLVDCLGRMLSALALTQRVLPVEPAVKHFLIALAPFEEPESCCRRDEIAELR